MFLVVGDNKNIEDLVEESMFSELGIWERKHIEDWIREYPEILEEELLIVTTKYDKFDKTKENEKLTMPTVLRIRGFRFFFFSNEGKEPIHIHVESDDKYAKFWLTPVQLAKSVGYSAGN